MKLAVISFTDRGGRLGEDLVRRLEAGGHVCGFCRMRRGGESLRDWTGRMFQEMDGLIFIGAAGIAVRAIAPFVRDKMTDPAVVVMDEAGRFAVPLLSGHMGGANDLAREAASAVGAVCAVTTATDVRQVWAADLFARRNGLYIGSREAARRVSADLLAGKPVGLQSDFPLDGALPAGLVPGPGPEGTVWVSRRNQWPGEALWKTADGGPGDAAAGEPGRTAGDRYVLQLIPRTVHAGIGCRKGTPDRQIEGALRQAMAVADCRMEALASLASADRKKEEPGLVETAARLGVPFHTYSPEELRKAEGIFPSSDFVKAAIGVDNVCQRAAVLELGRAGGRVVLEKQVFDGVTVSLTEDNWRGVL